MANVLKYLTGALSKRAKRKGNLAVGIGEENYGPSSTTGYYAGVTPPDGGFVVYATGSNNNPKVFVAETENDLPAIARTLGGGILSVADAKTYIAGLTHAWVLDNVPKNEITDELVLDLNANNLTSYPESGTIWRDTSGNNIDGTLINGTGYSNGALVFDGSNDYVGFAGGVTSSFNSTEFTVEAVVNYDAFGVVNSSRPYVSNWNTWSPGSQKGFILRTYGVSQNPSFWWCDGTNYTSITATTTMTTGKYYHILATYSSSGVKLYVNGNIEATSSNLLTGVEFGSALRIGWGTINQGWFDGKISLVRMYNKALSQVEVGQNYYGANLVTNNLYAAFDPTNLVSYESGSSQIYNLADVPNTDHDGNVHSAIEVSNVGNLKFGGTRYTNVYHSQDFDFPGWNGYSVGIWVKRTGWGTWKSGNNNYDGIWNYYWNHNLHFTGYHTGLNQISGTGLSGYNIDFDKWYYVVTTHDNSPVANNHKVYINGQLVQTSTLGVAGYDSDGVTPKRFYVGNWDSSWSMVGDIGAYHIYQDALTEEEVFQNYNTYKARYLNDLEEIETSGEWLKVFRQYSGTGDFFSSANDWAEAKSTNVGNPNANKYSILDRVADYQIDSKYTFKLVYPQSGLTNIWSQTNNPVTDDGTGGVTGYTAISIDMTSNGWGGLERYDAQNSTFLDGTLSPISNWYYAIGSKSWGSATTFPGHSPAVNEVELWIKYK